MTSPKDKLLIKKSAKKISSQKKLVLKKLAKKKPLKETFYISSKVFGNFKISLIEQALFEVQRTTKKPVKNQAPLSRQALKIKQLMTKYFQGQKICFSIPLADRGTAFQNKVWQALSCIPYAQTNTYQDISLKIGSSKKARAVGQACAKNPFLIVVPCHRVVAQNHLGGFALGLKIKKDLLNLEQKTIAL